MSCKSVLEFDMGKTEYLGAYREEETERSEKDTMDALLVDALRSPDGPDVEERSSEKHKTDKKEQAKDAVPLTSTTIEVTRIHADHIFSYATMAQAQP